MKKNTPTNIVKTSTKTHEGTGKKKLLIIFIAAILPVLLWSLKPVFITTIGDNADFATIFLAAVTISIIVSILIAVTTFKWIMKPLFSRQHRVSLYSGLKHTFIAGFFLAAWYYGFYRALQEAPAVEATIISFSWPLVAVIATPLLSKGKWVKLTKTQWLLMLSAFGGAVMIALNTSESTSGSPYGLVWAFIAALGSGLYLPFLVNATTHFNTALKNSPAATFCSISIANMFSMVTVLVALAISNHSVSFSPLGVKDWVICGIIGVGIYLVAEVLWTWAFKEYSSLALQSLPYFSPAISVMLLFLLFDENITIFAVGGLLLILGSNLLIHYKPAKMKKRNVIKAEFHNE